MSWLTEVFVLPMAHPADWSGLEGLVEEGTIKPQQIVAVLGKTEGNGCVNDFTRAYAASSLETLLRTWGLSAGQMPVIVMSGGTEGVLSPHATVFVRCSVADSAPNGGDRLLVSARHSALILPEELGRLAQVRNVAETVRACLIEGDFNEVAFVQVKCPLLTSARINQARARNKTVSTTDTYKSMALSRAAAALGVAVALGEIEESILDDQKIGQDWSLFSRVASTSSGIELMNHEICVMGNSHLASGNLRIGSAVMQHPLDQKAFDLALARATRGLPEAHLLSGDIVQVLAKAEAPPDGLVFGKRHTMLEDSDIPHSRMARAVVGAVLAAAAGKTALYVSGGAEHQGPPGGGPVAVILKVAG